jgi:rubrerythrin
MADDKALEILKGARNAEEKSIPIYTKHLESALFWTGISEDRALKAREILKRLAAESAAHKIAVEALIARLERR